jgi:hypothetical protein
VEAKRNNMPLSDIPTVIKDVLGYFGPAQHELRVLRKFIGWWDVIRPNMLVEGKKENIYLVKMDKLRKELK